MPATRERRLLDRLLDAIEETSLATHAYTIDGDVVPVRAPDRLLSWYAYVGGRRTDVVTLAQLHDAVLELEE